MKNTVNSLKMVVSSLILIAAFATSYADAADTSVTPQTLHTDQTIVFDFGWSCGGFCQ